MTTSCPTRPSSDLPVRFRDALAQPAPAVPDLPFPEDYPDEYRMRRRECGLQLYDAVGVAHGDRAASGAQAARNFVLFDAPHVAIVTSRRELGVYGAVDCGAYVGTFLQIGSTQVCTTVTNEQRGGQRWLDK